MITEQRNNTHAQVTMHLEKLRADLKSLNELIARLDAEIIIYTVNLEVEERDWMLAQASKVQRVLIEHFLDKYFKF